MIINIHLISHNETIIFHAFLLSNSLQFPLMTQADAIKYIN